MNEDTLFLAGIVLVFAITLFLEWRYRLKSMRVVAAVMALGLLLALQPAYHAAWRIAIGTPRAERVMHWNTLSDYGDRPLSEYESGVFTMTRAVATVGDARRRERWLMVGVLFWLVCSPVFRRTGDHARERHDTSGALALEA